MYLHYQNSQKYSQVELSWESKILNERYNLLPRLNVEKHKRDQKSVTLIKK